MPQTTGYKKTVPDTLLALFKSKLGESIFKAYYMGDPIIIPHSLLPAMIISEPATDYDDGPTGFDEIKHNVLIQICFDKRSEFGKKDKEATLERTIDNIAQGRDETTGDYKDISIVGILRRNITLGNLSIRSINGVQKGIVDRSETLTTTEAHIKITITELQSVANRV